MMGTAQAEIDKLSQEYKDWTDWFKREGPQHKVTIAKPFAVGRFAVTRGEFSAFVNETGYSVPDEAQTFEGDEYELRKDRSFRNSGFGQDDSHPVVCVNWDDAKAYVQWLSGKTGKDYRLLSEAEWEYACRAGTATPFWWGSSISTEQANYNGNHAFGGGKRANTGREPFRRNRFSRTLGGSIRSTATSGNGARISGMKITTMRRPMVRRGQSAIVAVIVFAAVPGTTIRGFSVGRPSSGTLRPPSLHCRFPSRHDLLAPASLPRPIWEGYPGCVRNEFAGTTTAPVLSLRRLTGAVVLFASAPQRSKIFGRWRSPRAMTDVKNDEFAFRHPVVDDVGVVLHNG